MQQMPRLSLNASERVRPSPQSADQVLQVCKRLDTAIYLEQFFSTTLRLLAPKATSSIFAIMALLVDKLRPRSLEALTYHKDLSTRLSSLVRFPTFDPSTLLLSNTTVHRPPPPTSHTSSSTALLAPAKRPVSSRPSVPSTAPAWKRSRSTPVSSRRRRHANSNSTSCRACTTSRSPLQTSATTTAS